MHCPFLVALYYLLIGVAICDPTVHHIAELNAVVCSNAADIHELPLECLCGEKVNDTKGCDVCCSSTAKGEELSCRTVCASNVTAPPSEVYEKQIYQVVEAFNKLQTIAAPTKNIVGPTLPVTVVDTGGEEAEEEEVLTTTTEPPEEPVPDECLQPESEARRKKTHGSLKQDESLNDEEDEISKRNEMLIRSLPDTRVKPSFFL